MEIKIGTQKNLYDVVTKDKLACYVGSGSLAVYATPMVIALMEKVSAEIAQEFVCDGYTTVGTAVSVEHISATPENAQVHASATLTECDGRKFVFAVEAYDSFGLIAKGTHTRFAVKTEKFMAKTNAKRNS